ncbi:hypothetical protein [Pelosinus sp. sgz500959]|uniref:hypothetical protein n=1 Tax=Pelosinus sp. sgz500959 TaxID=3242472 RepID=UPI00366FF843
MSMYIQQAINLYVQKIREYKDAAEAKGIRIAIYQGNGQVSLGGVMYGIEMANDVHLRHGQIVYVILNQAGTKAVIIG